MHTTPKLEFLENRIAQLDSGDYTQERKQWLDDLKLEDIISEIKARRKTS